MKNKQSPDKESAMVSRTCGIVEKINEHFLLEIVHNHPRKGPQTGYYLCREVPADFGTVAYEVEKEDGLTVYTVEIDEERGHHHCDCQGFRSVKHRKACKHVESLLALRKAGRLNA
jgi:hypothetical protein